MCVSVSITITYVGGGKGEGRGGGGGGGAEGFTVVVFQGSIHRNIQSTKIVDIHNNNQTVIFKNNTWKK